MILFRFVAPLALVLCLVAWLLVPLTDRLFLNWAEADLQMRSRLVFSSIEADWPNDLTNDHASQLAKRFTQLTQDERLIGIGYCEAAGPPKYRNKDFPAAITCDAPGQADPQFKTQVIKGGKVMAASFPVAGMQVTNGAGTPGTLLIVHDMSYAERRSEKTRNYILAFMFGISMLAALLTMAVAKLTLSRWMNGLRDYLRTGKRGFDLPREAIVLRRDIQQRIREIEREHTQRPLLAGPRWSASKLFEFVRKNLPSEQLIAVSYRQPYAHKETGNGLEWSVPASGLVTAVEPIMKACKGTWVAVATSEADRKSANAEGALMVPPDQPSYRLKRLWLSEAEEAGFYAGCANEGIWPLCHMAYVKPHFRASDWEMYKAVNRKFADAVVAEAKSDAPIVFIQDYHFGLLPRMIREKLPNALIVIFWHITWPNAELFSIMPWREAFLDGMLAADIVGLHTQLLCNNFLDCVDTHVEALVDREHDTVRRGDDFCMVRPYPISIAWPDFAELGVPDVAACRAEFVERLKIDPSVKIILGVERLDYIKGIPERLRAFEIFLEQNPDWHGRVCLAQVASPSRSIIPAYANIDQEIEDMATAINRKFGIGGWQPIHILKQNFGQTDVYKFYRAADICIVSSLHEGMNLVAKEFIAAREDERGVLILSQFASSSRELIDALIVNPYNEEGLSQSLLRALTMGAEEQGTRLRSMREHVKANNVFGWAAEILGDAATLNRRRRLNGVLKDMNPQLDGAKAIAPPAKSAIA